MSLKVHLLAAAIALAVTGKALAGQSEAFVTSLADTSTSGSKATLVRQPKSPGHAKIPVTIFTDSHLELGVFRGQIADGTYDGYSGHGSGSLAGHQRIDAFNADDGLQTFSGSHYAPGQNNHGADSGNGYNRGSGGDNRDYSGDFRSGDFRQHFQPGHDHSGPTGDWQYFNCTISAVPEPGQGLLMLCGLGLMAYFTWVRKRIALFACRQYRVKQGSLA